MTTQSNRPQNSAKKETSKSKSIQEVPKPTCGFCGTAGHAIVLCRHENEHFEYDWNQYYTTNKGGPRLNVWVPKKT